jgi:NADP-dependent 3-hydroxy acid dehydrogenase YdfG
MSNGRLSNKVAIVTGASQGFGAGIAAKFLAEGAKVISTSKIVLHIYLIHDTSDHTYQTST